DVGIDSIEGQSRSDARRSVESAETPPLRGIGIPGEVAGDERRDLPRAKRRGQIKLVPGAESTEIELDVAGQPELRRRIERAVHHRGVREIRQALAEKILTEKVEVAAG